MHTYLLSFILDHDDLLVDNIYMANGGDAIPRADPHNQMSIFSIVFPAYLFCLIEPAVQSML